MTPEQTVDLLSLIAARDRRTVGKTDVMAWHTDVGDLAFEDCREAVALHFRESTDWLMPAHVRQLVRRIRDDRLRNADKVVPPADPDDPAAYLAALRAQTRALADGRHPANALPAGDPPSYDDSPTVRRIREEFDAQREAARARKDAEAAAEREAIAAYVKAVGELLELEDYGAAAKAAARQALFGDEQAALGFPLAADRIGACDEHKVTILAAEIAREEP